MKAFYLAVCAALVWGVVPVLEKAGLAGLSPKTGMIFRCIGVMIGAAILLAFYPGVITEAASAGFRGPLLFVLAGFLANFIGQLLFYNALKAGEVSMVTPITGAYPLIAFILGVIIFQETVTVPNVIGIALVLAGIFLLIPSARISR